MKNQNAQTDYDYFRQIIEKYGLKPTSQRELPLFTMSCIANGYIINIKEALGFSYRACCAIGGKGKFHTLLNEDYVAQKTGELVEKEFKDLDKLFLKIKQNSKKLQDKTKDMQKLTLEDPFECLRLITELYPDYMVSIGGYNCFWRYIGNNTEKGKLKKEQVEKIGEERAIIAKVYPPIEEIIKRCSEIIGGLNGFDGDLIRYLTLSEMKEFVKIKVISKEKIEELNRRRENYFYSGVEPDCRERVITDNKIIDRIYDNFYKVKEEAIKEIKGHPAYPGVVRGSVYNFSKKSISKGDKAPENSIFVASQTHPDDLSIIKGCKAIVTDEGGILSHAAIVARELKIPTIIGTKIATQILKDGDLIEVDAEKGIVRIIK